MTVRAVGTSPSRGSIVVRLSRESEVLPQAGSDSLPLRTNPWGRTPARSTGRLASGCSSSSGLGLAARATVMLDRSRMIASSRQPTGRCSLGMISPHQGLGLAAGAGLPGSSRDAVSRATAAISRALGGKPYVSIGRGGKRLQHGGIRTARVLHHRANAASRERPGGIPLVRAGALPPSGSPQRRPIRSQANTSALPDSRWRVG